MFQIFFCKNHLRKLFYLTEIHIENILLLKNPDKKNIIFIPSDPPDNI